MAKLLEKRFGGSEVSLKQEESLRKRVCAKYSELK